MIQVAGRAARNINGRVIMYADTVTDSMKRALDESNRRRKIQLEYNKQHDITPRSIQKAIKDGIEIYQKAEETAVKFAGESIEEHEINNLIAELEYEMQLAARNLQFEKAAYFRDEIKKLKQNWKASAFHK